VKEREEETFFAARACKRTQTFHQLSHCTAIKSGNRGKFKGRGEKIAENFQVAAKCEQLSGAIKNIPAINSRSMRL
jgi:hypothetical protein